MKKKRILVAGGAGFIGSNFANRHKENYEVIVLDNLMLGDPKNLDEGITFIEGDAGNLKHLEKVGPVDFVINLAGTSSQPMFNGENFVSAYLNSVQSFNVILEWARKNKTKKILFASTSSLYGNNPTPLTEDQQVIPPNHYAVTKQFYEGCARCYNQVYPELEIIGFRFMSVYGPNEEAKGEYANLISQFIWDIARDKKPKIYGDGKQTRDFTNVADVVQGITLAMETDKEIGFDIFNIGTGYSVSLNEITDSIYKAFARENEAEHIENPVKEAYIKNQHADISKIQQELDYQPKIKLEDGIKMQVESLRLDRIRQTSSDLLNKKQEK